MNVTPLALDGLLRITLDVRRDERGFFAERFHATRFAHHGLPTAFVQDNHSRSEPGVLRGLHYDRTFAQGKLVGVVRGRVFDAIVDLRPASPTFGRHVTLDLDGDSGALVWIPPGFA